MNKSRPRNFENKVTIGVLVRRIYLLLRMRQIFRESVYPPSNGYYFSLSLYDDLIRFASFSALSLLLIPFYFASSTVLPLLSYPLRRYMGGTLNGYDMLYAISIFRLGAIFAWDLVVARRAMLHSYPLPFLSPVLH